MTSARVAAHGDTALFFGGPDVDAAYRAIRQQGIAHRGMKQLYLTDPDGYSLCFQWPV